MLVVITGEGTASLSVILLERMLGVICGEGDCVLKCYLIGKGVGSNLWGMGLRP